MTATLGRRRVETLAVLALIALGLAFGGYLSAGVSVVDAAYDTLALITLNFNRPSGAIPWSLEIGRFLIPMLAAYATLAALMAAFREQSDLLRGRVRRRHVIVCGLGRRGLGLTKSLLAERRPVVAIELDRDCAEITEARRAGAAVIIGDASDAEVLRRAGVNHADTVIGVCSNDAVNAAIAARLHKLATTRGLRLQAFAHVARAELAEELNSAALAKGDGPWTLEWFNVHSLAARTMLREHVDLSAPTAPHLTIVGLDELATSLVLNASRIRLATTGGDASPLRITLVSPGAGAWISALEARHPALVHAASLEPYEADVRSLAHGAETRARLRDASAVFVCAPDDTSGIELAFAVARLATTRAPIVVRLLLDTTGFSELFEAREGDVPGVHGIEAFGLINRTLTAEMVTAGLHETLARMFHERHVNETLRQGKTLRLPEHFDELSPTLKEANRAQARHVSTKLAAAGCRVRPLIEWNPALVTFSADEVERLAEMEHERWMAERFSDGWRYAAERDEARKLSPYLVPWADLDDDIRDYDRAFARELPQMLAAAGYEVYRQAGLGGVPAAAARRERAPAS